MKTIRDFLRRHALLLLAALVVVSVPVGGALGKYAASETVTDGLSLNVSMTQKYSIDKQKMWEALNKLTNGPTTLKFVKGSKIPSYATLKTQDGIQTDGSGKIGVYLQNNIIYIAPMDKSDSTSVMYAPENCSGFLKNSNIGTNVNFIIKCSLTSISFENLDTSHVTDFSGMFDYLSNVSNLDLSNIKTGSARNMSGMFTGCSKLTKLDLSGFNTANVTDMSSMFNGCSALNSLNLKSFNTGNVEAMSAMFYRTGLTELDLKHFDTNKVANMASMFAFSSKLTKLNLDNFNTSSVTNMANMFYSCSNLKTIYVGNEFVTTSVNDGGSMFTSCDKLEGGAGTTYASSKVMDKTYARIDGGTSAPGYFWSATGTQSLTNSVNVNVESAYGFHAA